MTAILTADVVAQRLRATAPDAVRTADARVLVLHASGFVPAMTFLRDDPALDLIFLSNLTAVDYESHMELVYHLQSLDLNHLLTVKVLLADRDAPEAPSLTPVYAGALLQEREVYDLFGIRFSGHPDLRRIFLWDGFPGHPLRKDFLNLPGTLRAGLPGFPHESGANAWPVPGSVPSGARPQHPNVPRPGDFPYLPEASSLPDAPNLREEKN